jgi:putative Mg2+ transporter-C (MgtC) family protein
MMDWIRQAIDIINGWSLQDNFIFKLGIAALFGSAIGLDRELKKKPLGLKTCLVLSVSSCLLTIVSIESAYLFPKSDRTMMDPLRLAAQIVSGVGFIGAGVILKRSNEVIVGLTTAAMIWGASGIGLAVGAGYYWESFFGLLFILFGVDFLPFLMKRWGPKTLRLRELDLQLIVKETPGNDLDAVIAKMSACGIDVKTAMIKDLDGENIQVQMRIETDSKSSVTRIFNIIRGIDGVSNVDVRAY